MQAGGNAGGAADDIDGGGVIEPEELAFAHEDERLPWLEADDEVEEGAVDTSRVIAFVLISLVVLGVAIGALWWVFRDRSGRAIVADGSTIHAPAGPYKTKPANPGGSEAVGTGDTSFKVAEGEDVQGQVADTSVPSPSIDRNQTGTGPSTSAPAGPTTAEAAATEGVGVQVGAYSTRDRAETGWSTLTTRHPELSGVKHRIEQATVDGSQVFRLQAVASDAKTAAQLCSTLKSQGADCQVKD